MGDRSLLDTLREYAHDGRVGDVQAVTRAREALEKETPLPLGDDRDAVRSAAREAYNRCVEGIGESAKTAQAAEVSTHMRALCLTVLELLEPSSSDADLASRLKAWGRTGAHFGHMNDAAESDRCFRKAEAVLRANAERVGEPELIEGNPRAVRTPLAAPVLVVQPTECRASRAAAAVLLKGWEALCLHLTRRSEALVLQKLQEALALCKQHDAQARETLAAALY